MPAEDKMWITRWNRIAARIEGLRATSDLFLRSVAAQGGDAYGISNSHIISEAREILDSLQIFSKDFQDVIPANALDSLREFLVKANRPHSAFQNADGGIPGVAATTVSLSTIRAALGFHLSGAESSARSITERAFEHLQRSIVADEEHRNKWISAFRVNETTCEKLGAVHLLLHGIWAFKINAAGARTDLVFGEPLNLGQAERTASAAIVLTEWKIARSTGEIKGQFEAARKQARLYAGGALSDLELSAVRFLVVVAEREVDPPEDIVEGNIRYRHKVIAVNPDSPSVAAKKSL